MAEEQVSVFHQRARALLDPRSPQIRVILSILTSTWEHLLGTTRVPHH